MDKKDWVTRSKLTLFKNFLNKKQDKNTDICIKHQKIIVCTLICFRLCRRLDKL